MHAAHERVLYEKLKAERERGTPASQLLLEPVVIELKAHELAALLERHAEWERAGFELDALSATRLALRRVPATLKPAEISRIITAVVHDLGLEANTHHLEAAADRSEEHTSELQSLRHLVCRLLLEKKKSNPATPRSRRRPGTTS